MAMQRHPGRGGRAWDRVRALVLKDATHCHICWRPLDFDAPPRSPLSPSVDHLLPIQATRGMDAATQRRIALDPNNLRPAHYGCNSARRDRPLRRSRKRRTSRDW